MSSNNTHLAGAAGQPPHHYSPTSSSTAVDSGYHSLSTPGNNGGGGGNSTSGTASSGSGPFKRTPRQQRPPSPRPQMYGVAPSAGVFTREMRDRQSRGKDPYGSDEDGSGNGGHPEFTSGSSGMLGQSGSRIGSDQGEPREVLEKRMRARIFLEDPELLMIRSLDTGESTTAARLHFMSQLCGLDPESKYSRAANNSRSIYQAHSGGSVRSGPGASGRSNWGYK
ncbi:uncharacterized protein PpBr36_06326 [Pyricularia pennisetigena]|uniref:uncharacterized protein n=1 Tax=Pyricularia pennisetigena TaxID=1578925 RepID=UPI00115328C9|nr:uncharacterized protein PpBr36_06326 [Pyricularia pennisetigena]TLS23463.1 hypothetical protein PpBr36_06326 [Pyricularia pennisetigena]